MSRKIVPMLSILFFSVHVDDCSQWRIQDFPKGRGANSQSGCANLFFIENCMKMKEFGPPGTRSWRPPPLDLPMAPLILTTVCEDLVVHNHIKTPFQNDKGDFKNSPGLFFANKIKENFKVS